MGERFTGMRIPRFEDAVQVAREQGIGLYLDIKTKGIAAAPAGNTATGRACWSGWFLAANGKMSAALYPAQIRMLLRRSTPAATPPKWRHCSGKENLSSLTSQQTRMRWTSTPCAKRWPRG